MARTGQTSRNVPKSISKKQPHGTGRPASGYHSVGRDESTPTSSASSIKSMARNAARKNATPIRKFQLFFHF